MVTGEESLCGEVTETMGAEVWENTSVWDVVSSNTDVSRKDFEVKSLRMTTCGGTAETDSKTDLSVSVVAASVSDKGRIRKCTEIRSEVVFIRKRVWILKKLLESGKSDEI